MDLLHVAATPGMLRSRITAASGSTNAVYYILSSTINIKANVPHLLTVRIKKRRRSNVAGNYR